MAHTLTKAQLEKRDRVEGIHWGGDMKNRYDFNKRKDGLVNWTEVLFRS